MMSCACKQGEISVSVGKDENTHQSAILCGNDIQGKRDKYVHCVSWRCGLFQKKMATSLPSVRLDQPPLLPHISFSKLPIAPPWPPGALFSYTPPCHRVLALSFPCCRGSCKALRRLPLLCQDDLAPTAVPF